MSQRSQAQKHLRGLLAALCACVLLAFPAVAEAAVETINFDGNDVINTEVDKPLETAGLITFSRSLGFRPYRTEAVGRAKTGKFVGDLGRCIDEALANGEDTFGCEHFQAQGTAVLSHIAETVSLYAGHFGPFPEEAKLTAYNVLGEVVASTRQPIGADFKHLLEVKDPSGQIAKFTVEAFAQGGEGVGDLGIDEVSVNFTGSGKPDFFITTTSQVVPIVQGQTAEVPVNAVRLNGSNGKVELRVENLPEGVSAFPAEIEAGKSSGTIKLIAAPGAPDTNFELTEAKIVATPANQNVGPGPRAAKFSTRVATDFKLSSGEIGEGDTRKVLVETPDCAPVDVPLRIDRDIAMNRDVALSVTGSEGNGLPEGIGAEFLPSATVSPGGNLAAERTLRLRAGPASEISEKAIELQLQGSDDPHNPPRALELAMLHVDGATIANSTPGSGLGTVPMFMKEGTLVRVHGLGFCPGTQVRVGNSIAATVPAKLVDEHTLEFRVPRYATTGRVTIIPPGSLRSYQTEDRLVVNNGRNSAAFPFDNYRFGTLGIDEFTKAFGDDEIFVHVNPCWPFGDCSFSTGFLSPTAAIDWGWMNLALRNTDGHCFGINLAIQQLESGKEPRRKYSDANASPNPHSAYEMSTESGPGPLLNDFLDAMHARQFSEEFMSARLDRNRSMQAQLSLLERELKAGHQPMIVLEHNSTVAHAILPFDLERTPTGAKIFVYDNEVPFTLNEEVSGGEHANQVERNTITISTITNEWSFPVRTAREDTWQGSGSDGSFWVVPLNAVPEDPSLPSLGTVAHSVAATLGIGSANGAVRADAASPGAEFMPTSELGGPLGNGIVASKRRGRPLRAVIEGVKAGRYTESYAAPGFTADLRDVDTARGVRDGITGSGDGIAFDSGLARPLTIELARRSSAAMSTAATLETRSSAHGSDSAGLGAGGALTYAHEGAPTTLRFSLTAVRREGGPSTFVSPPVAVARGARLRVEPMGRDLRRVRLEIRNVSGHRTTKVLRSRGGAPARLKLGAASATRRRVSVRFSVAALHQHAVVGAVLRLMRGHRVVARHAVSRLTANGARKLGWRLRHRLAPGSYKLLVDLRLVSTGARGSTVTGSVSAHRASVLRVR